MSQHSGAQAEANGEPRMERNAALDAIRQSMEFLRGRIQTITSEETTTERKNPTPCPNFNGRTLDDFEILKQVGLGTYGEVYKARDKKTHEIVALKKILVHRADGGYPITALREIKIMQHLEHQNILSLREIVPSSTNVDENDLGVIYMVMEYMDYDLTGIIGNRQFVLTDNHIRCYMKQLLEGIFYIHKNNIVHRDLKAANILISNTGSLKIGDWGLSRSWKNGKKYTTRVVTLWYRAPELILGISQYTPAIDLWAVGCIFAELLTKDSPFPGDKELGQIKRIFEVCGTPNEENWPGVTQTPMFKEVKFDDMPSTFDQRFLNLKPTELDLLKKLLTLDPRKRITAKDALDHDYFWETTLVKPGDLPRISGDGLHEYEVKMQRSQMRDGGKKPSRGGNHHHNNNHHHSLKRGSSSSGPRSNNHPTNQQHGNNNHHHNRHARHNSSTGNPPTPKKHMTYHRN